MANELNANYNGTATIYAIIRRRTDMYVWNGTTFESWDNSNIANYDVALASAGGDVYSANWPSSITNAGYYRVTYYKQAGGSPATSDYIIDSEQTYWTGTASGGTGGGTGGTATFTLAEARTLVRLYARNAGDSSVYTDSDIDRAILSAGNDFVNRTRCAWETASLTLTASDSTYSSIGATADGFRPDRIKRVYIPAQGSLQVVSIDAIEDSKYASGETTEGLPTQIAFTTDQTFELYPVPDDTYVLKTHWHVPFSPFDPGASGSTVLNVPNDLIRPLVQWGATYNLMSGLPEHQAIVAQYKQNYEEHVARSKGFANVGPKVIQLNPYDSIPLRRIERETYT